RCPAQRGNSQRMINLAPICQPFNKGLVPRLLHALRNLFHCPIQRLYLPVIAKRCTVKYLCEAARIDRILERCGTFGAECTWIDGTICVYLDVQYLTIFYIDIQTASDRAIGADAMHHFGIADTRRFLVALLAKRLHA